MNYLTNYYKNQCDILQERINFLEKTLKEQKLAHDETTLDPEFLEKKKRKDQQVELKIEKPSEKIHAKADQDMEKDMHTI